MLPKASFKQQWIEESIARQMRNLSLKYFLGMFAVAGFSHETLMEPDASPQEKQKMAEGLADIFLNGVLEKE